MRWLSSHHPTSDPINQSDHSLPIMITSFPSCIVITHHPMRSLPSHHASWLLPSHHASWSLITQQDHFLPINQCDHSPSTNGSDWKGYSNIRFQSTIPLISKIKCIINVYSIPTDPTRNPYFVVSFLVTDHQPTRVLLFKNQRDRYFTDLDLFYFCLYSRSRIANARAFASEHFNS
jgi:hypothetical protein